MAFKNESGNWTAYRELPGVTEIDFHRSDEPSEHSYWEAMDLVRAETLASLKWAQANGKRYLLIRHGHSTSHQGTTTSRSQVRGLMRSPDATPYILRSQSIQHYSVFVAAIRPLPAAEPDDEGQTSV